MIPLDRCAIVLLSLLLASCARNVVIDKSSGQEVVKTSSSFDPKQLAKSDIDRVADTFRRELFGNIRVLAEKLYRRNPREWKKGGYQSLEVALDKLLDPRTGWRSASLRGKRGTDAILLSLQVDFTGDRVAAFINGLGGMLNAAFDNKTEFFMFDSLDAQLFYNSARNVEIAAWKLSNARDAAGNLLLLSNEINQPPLASNLSMEREFGKMVGHLDLITILLADRSNRNISRVVQSITTAVFLPVPGS
ncbi:MAG: hypothetical protein KBA96_08025 [Rhodocyclaceae bacterium]|nr:hypothetical protein [Rhodocyclaceae bacterium]